MSRDMIYAAVSPHPPAPSPTGGAGESSRQIGKGEQPDEANLPAARRSRWRGYRALWPMALLLAGETAAIALFAPPGPGDVRPGSLALALAVLMAGLLPALLRPTPITNLVGCSAVVLASVLWRAFDTGSGAPTFAELGQALARGEIRLALLNVALLAPLTLHLAARFPRRGPIGGPVLAGYYALIAGIALATFALPPQLRQGSLVALAVAAYTGFGLADYQLLRAIRSARPDQLRAAQQARLLLLLLILTEAPLLLLPISGYISLFIPYEVAISAQILLPLGITYVIMRQDLFGLDTAMRRALDYALVSFGLLIVYFGLTALLTQLTGSLGGRWGFGATVLSVVAAAATFTPLLQASQRLIDRVLYPERLRFAQAIDMARAALAHVVQRESAIRLLTDDLPRQIGAAWAEIALRPSFGQPAAAGQPGVWSTLLTVGGQPIGQYWLGPRSSAPGYAADERKQLQALVQQAALALAYADTFDNLARLNDELEERVAIRTEHVVAQQRELAAFEERQRLARDLHDSVKQTLFSLGIGLRAVRGRLRADPDAALAFLEQQEQAAIQAQVEMGELLAQLRTPASGTGDVVLLLAEQAAWLARQHGMHITQRLPPALVLPEPLPRELAQVAREALLNVLRHSGTTAADLGLAAEGGQLRLTVADAGRGFDPSRPSQGHGLRSMRERVALLGGTFEVRTAPGEGTTICVQISLESRAPHPQARSAS